MNMSHKRIHGQFYTQLNPFNLPGFKEWWALIPNPHSTLLEPFAGSNNIIHMLQQEKFITQNYASYDIDPQLPTITKQNTISNFPEGFDIVVTNPPYLAVNVASRRKLTTAALKHNDIYKDCIDLCLQHSKWVAAIIPASFINSGLFLDRLYGIIELTTDNMFADTQHPTCLALFVPKGTNVKTKVWRWDTLLGSLDQLKLFHDALLKECTPTSIQCNKLDGQIGLLAIDNTFSDSITFLKPNLIEDSEVSATSRTKTRIKITPAISDVELLITELNRNLNRYRTNTKDIFLTPFKGLRKDNTFRRRIDFTITKKLIAYTLNNLTKQNDV